MIYTIVSLLVFSVAFKDGDLVDSSSITVFVSDPFALTGLG